MNLWEILEVIHATKENLQVNTEIIIFWENQNCRTGTIEMAFQGCKIDKDNKTEDSVIISPDSANSTKCIFYTMLAKYEKEYGHNTLQFKEF